MIEPGERVQILGKAGAGKGSLFQALAGMWPWGSGTIQLPPRGAVTFLPPRPYLPTGTLRAAIAYPNAPDRFEPAAVVAALSSVDWGIWYPASIGAAAGTASSRSTSSSAWPLSGCFSMRRVG